MRVVTRYYLLYVWWMNQRRYSKKKIAIPLHASQYILLMKPIPTYLDSGGGDARRGLCGSLVNDWGGRREKDAHTSKVTAPSSTGQKKGPNDGVSQYSTILTTTTLKRIK